MCPSSLSAGSSLHQEVFPGLRPVSVQGGEDGAHVWSRGHHGVQERPSHLGLQGPLQREATLRTPVQRDLRGLQEEEQPRRQMHGRGEFVSNILLLTKLNNASTVAS